MASGRVLHVFSAYLTNVKLTEMKLQEHNPVFVFRAFAIFICVSLFSDVLQLSPGAAA